ncbi:MAG TPA: hypothetical protein VFN88_01280 [Caulobacteraceae bacterium]|nr:hypothetical protein [Caulobacteraceae bacterium]
MPDSITPFLALVKPEVGASADTWGGKLNNDFDAIDAAIQSLVEAGNYAAASGADTIAVTLDPAPSAYVEGLRVRFRAAGDNTTTPTLNVSGLGARPIKYADGSTPAAGDLATGVVHTVDFDGTAFVLTQAPLATAAEAKGATSRHAISPLAAAVVNSGGVTEWALGGLCLKCGTVTATSAASGSGGEAAVTFPTAFPTACDAVLVSLDQPSGAIVDVSYGAYYRGKSTTGVQIGVDQTAPPSIGFAVSWLAIGR